MYYTGASGRLIKVLVLSVLPSFTFLDGARRSAGSSQFIAVVLPFSFSYDLYPLLPVL